MVTSQKDQIQSLIADIEQVLSREKPRKPWVKASDVEPQRQALVRAQAYLMSLQQSFEAPGGWGPVDPTTGQIAAPQGASQIEQQTTEQQTDVSSLVSPSQADASTVNLPPVGNSQDNRTGTKTDISAAENVLQALLTEMSFLKSSALQPLRQEMDSLRAERDDLSGEVRELAQRRNQALQELNQAQLEKAQLAASQSEQPALTEGGANVAIGEDQLNEFLQVLMSRLQEKLSVQVTETLGQLEAEHSSAMAKLTAATEIEILELKPTGQIEEIRQIQSRSDQLLANIDSTLQQMFETLQTNIDSYQLSLNEGIENMHSLGRQGEVIVRSLVDHLTQQLGQTTPPEPIFYPSQPSAFADSTSDSADTVSSLNEILPATTRYATEADYPETSDEEISKNETDLVAKSTDVTELDSTEADDTRETSEAKTAEETDTSLSATTQIQEDSSERFIKEDGTIDLDLLRLDIDRSEDDPSLSRDDLMVDAETADAEVAAAEAENQDNLEIESKVKPTADAVFLADLTFDDLVVDDSALGAQPLEVSDVPVSEISVSEVTVSELEVEDDLVSEQATASSQATALSEETTLEETDSTNSDTEEARPESAAVPDTPDSTDLDREADAFTTRGAENALIVEDDRLDDVIPDDLVDALTSDSEEAERVIAQSVDGDLDSLTPDLEEEVVFDGPLPTFEPLEEAADSPESATLPDQPAEDRPTEGPAARSAENSSSVDSADTSATQFPPESTPLPVTQFPPSDSSSDPFEDSLSEIEESSALPETPQTSSGVDSSVETAKHPADFDDDLDAFPSQTDEVNLDEVDLSDSSLYAEASGAISTADPEAIAARTEELSPPAETKSDSTATLIQPPADEGDDDPTNDEPADWFLGIDLGATGLSAVLINQNGEQVYPLCWNVAGDTENNRFRLPAVVQVNPEAEGTQQLGTVGPAALTQAGPYLRNLKLMIKAGIPRDVSGEPWMQWSDQISIPLSTLQAAVVELLAALRAEQTSCRAVGLKQAALRRALSNLKGIVVGYPTNWPDTYSFNVRECIISAGLIDSPDKIFFVEEALAALLSALPAFKPIADTDNNQQPGLYNCNWSGGTVVISAGAILTETAVANLPAELDQLSYQHFAMRGYTYAGDAIDQDIICQLMHAPLPQTKQGEQDVPADSIGRWETLGLSDITLPQPGEADRATRHRLRQRLNDSPLGREAILTARELKIALQEEEEVEVELGDHTWIITRKDLEAKVFLPYIQRINRQVNALLSKQNLATQDVKQVVCTGGSASLGAIARWLRQKFPNATIIQDTYAGEYSNSCSRVAYGLANLCHYPQVLDVNRHQYNDYFLLLELLRILPEQPLPAGGILHLLEQRGINTQACQSHVLALIEGHLPPGLVPTSGDRPLISARAADIATYKALSELPLFRKQGGQIYIADQNQGERLRSHLENLLSTKAQSLSEPMSPTALMSAKVQG